MAGLLLSLLEFVAPRHCSVCGRRLMPDEKALCTRCLMDIDLSVYADGKEGNTLERAFWLQLPIVRAAAFMTYSREDSEHRMVLEMKYHNKPDIGFHLGKLMSHQLKTNGFFSGVDAIIPMPIPLDKRMQRGYNQSEQLARGISLATGIPLISNAIKRLHYKTSQTHLTATERKENVKNTFRLRRDMTDKLRGKHLLLVDDVITSTSSMLEFGRTLCQIPDIKVSVLALAVSKNLIRNIRRINPVG